MTQPGQTDGFTASQHLLLVQQYLGRQVDAVILNLTAAARVPVSVTDLVEHPDIATVRSYERPQGAGMQVGLHLIRHDARKLAAQIMALASMLD
jgi:2-phospho-L-lactate transferase/gluconeogenesis factor (CofD/UPF0052 family)